MLLPSLLLALQTTVSVSAGRAGVDVEVARDTTQGDSTQRRAPRRVPVTDEHLRTAFKDAPARELLLRARAARMTQDSALLSYDAKTYQRVSVGMSLRETARSRLAFRMENAARVQWHRDVGAHVEMLGARAAVPFSREAERDARRELQSEFSLPYYPGKEPLISFSSGGIVAAEVDERTLVHPLAEGSEAYYTFATGDSVLMTLPDGKRLRLRELRIAAREPKWNVTVGSFWFEVERGHLVRAVYRLSTQLDIWTVANEESDGDMDEVPKAVKALITPMTADITAMSVEYGLQEQRFWMPRTQALEGYARVGMLRVPMVFEERYQYASVNVLESLPQIVTRDTVNRVAQLRRELREAGVDSVAVRDSVRRFIAARDSLRKKRRTEECAATGTYTSSWSRHNGAVDVTVSVPCDSAKLVNSPELPPSIYDSGEELFGVAEREELVKALTMTLQPGWGPQRPRYEYGLGYTRFNRVEGFSSGAAVKTTLGRGFDTELLARGSLADLQLNGELALSRSSGRRVVRGAAYRRLSVSSDFGDPFTFGASVANVLYARDEGFYHRAWGGELRGTRTLPGGIDWRLFAEEQWTAPVESRWTLTRGSNDERFIGNVAADRGWYFGGSARWRRSVGLDPRGWRASADVRAEAATGERDYVRGLVETIVSRGLGPVALSLTGSAGTSAGELPAQRNFFLGGLQTIRGQTAGTGIGESFWMGRLELGSSRVAVRPVLFGDLGWAGPRNGWAAVGRPLAGVGTGMSFLDGMIRMDLARGIHPRWQTRLDLYLEARF